MPTKVHFHTAGAERAVVGKFDLTPDEVEDMVYEGIGAGFITVPGTGNAHSVILPTASVTRVYVRRGSE